MRLSRTQIKDYRAAQLKKQGGLCPLCGLPIELGEDTLDHNHTTGKIRAVLHRACNTAEGKILSWCFRSKSNNPSELLSNLVRYWSEDFSNTPIHPNHLTKEQHEIRRLRRLMKKSKRQRTKQKYADLIKEVQNGQR